MDLAIKIFDIQLKSIDSFLHFPHFLSFLSKSTYQIFKKIEKQKKTEKPNVNDFEGNFKYQLLQYIPNESNLEQEIVFQLKQLIDNYLNKFDQINQEKEIQTSQFTNINNLIDYIQQLIENIYSSYIHMNGLLFVFDAEPILFYQNNDYSDLIKNLNIVINYLEERLQVYIKNNDKLIEQIVKSVTQKIIITTQNFLEKYQYSFKFQKFSQKSQKYLKNLEINLAQIIYLQQQKYTRTNKNKPKIKNMLQNIYSEVKILLYWINNFQDFKIWISILDQANNPLKQFLYLKLGKKYPYFIKYYRIYSETKKQERLDLFLTKLEVEFKEIMNSQNFEKLSFIELKQIFSILQPLLEETQKSQFNERFYKFYHNLLFQGPQNQIDYQFLDKKYEFLFQEHIWQPIKFIFYVLTSQQRIQFDHFDLRLTDPLFGWNYILGDYYQFTPFVLKNIKIFYFPFFNSVQLLQNQNSFDSLFIFLSAQLSGFSQYKNNQSIISYFELLSNLGVREYWLEAQKMNKNKNYKDLIFTKSYVNYFLQHWPLIINLFVEKKVQITDNFFRSDYLLNLGFRFISKYHQETLQEIDQIEQFKELLYISAQIQKRDKENKFKDIQLTDKQDQANIKNICQIIVGTKLTFKLMFDIYKERFEQLGNNVQTGSLEKKHLL